MSEPLSCFSPQINQGGMLSVAESQARILSAVSLPSVVERVDLVSALNRVLAEDQVSAMNVPPHRNSAMDGYAIALGNAQLPKYQLVGEVFAGQVFERVLQPGEAVVIMTGAPLPAGADTVLIKEAAQVADGWVSSRETAQAGQHVREAGEDIAEGQVVLRQGTRLRAQELGLLASLGYPHVPVFRPLRVAVFSTGDEVVAQGAERPEHAIYDTNRFTLQGMLKRLGCELIDLGIIKDTQAALTAAVTQGAQQADVLISSGGVSMGEADYIKAVLQQHGAMDFWRIAMRPGRPLAFGTVAGKPFFGLPGNPVAVMVTFLQFVQPALRKMQGELNWQPMRISARAVDKLRSRLGRTDYSRGIYELDANGELTVRSVGSQGSGILTSMVRGNCLIEIGDETEQVMPGERVIIQPFSDWI